MQTFLIILIFLFILIIFSIIFKKQVRNFIYWLFDILKNILKAIFTVFKKNKNIKSFFHKHYKIKNFIKARFNLKDKHGLRLTAILVILTLCASYFYFITKSYIYKELLFQFDIRLSNLFLFFRDIEIIKLFTFITNFADFRIIIIGALLFSIFLFINKKNNYLIPFFISISSASTLVCILKNIFDRVRPSISFYIVNGFSFPSGHAAISVAFFGFICYFLVRNTKKLNKKIIYIASSILISIAICFSRMYLGVHYLSDVMGGFLLGLFTLFIAIGISELFFMKENENKISYNFKNYYIFYILFLILVLSFTLIFEHKINPLENSFTNTIIMEYKESDIYKEFDNNNIPKYSEKLSGNFQEPIFL
jgi:undecaprenyl-diphosphatase